MDRIFEARPSDLERLCAAFDRRDRFERYLAEQAAGERLVFGVATQRGVVGYVTVQRTSDYGPFRAVDVPEIKDLNVLEAFRRRGFGSALLAKAELESRAPTVGIGVAMDPDYGPAQRLYARGGYVPDGRGLTSHGRHVKWGESVVVDDELVLYMTKTIPPYRGVEV